MKKSENKSPLRSQNTQNYELCSANENKKFVVKDSEDLQQIKRSKVILSLTANVVNGSASVHCLNNQQWIDWKGRSEVQEPYFLDWTPGLLGRFIKHFIISIRVAVPGTNWKLIKDVEWCVWVGGAGRFRMFWECGYLLKSPWKAPLFRPEIYTYR